MTEKKNSKRMSLDVYPEYFQAYAKMLEERGIGNRSEHILSLMKADAEAHGYELPLAAAPHGVRADSSVYPKKVE